MPRSGRGRGRTTKREPTPIEEIARHVMSAPTASYVERHVYARIRGFAEERGLPYEEDEFGNAAIVYQKGRQRRPLVLGAHTDHPGFVVSAVGRGRLDLEFRGGLSAEYGKDERVRLYSAASGESLGVATITSVEAQEGTRRIRQRLTGAKARLERDGAGDVQPGDLALWDVDEFRVRGDLIHARSCDDLGGVTAILATLDRAVAQGTTGHLVGLFTRAEEVGLLGAAAAARRRLLPEDALIVAVETSSMAGGRAEQGAGPIIRVGDLQHIFSPAMTYWMTSLAQELGDGDAEFRYQRKLMDGGTTEATAYDLWGYETGAACIALGNYHNAGPRGRIRAETVHIGDLDGLARLFVRMLETVPKYGQYLPRLKQRYDRLAKDAERRLRAQP